MGGGVMGFGKGYLVYAADVHGNEGSSRMIVNPRELGSIALASDHAGFALKERLKDYLSRNGWDVIDLGTHGTESVDYPAYGDALATAIANGTAWRGVAVCGTGIGISIAANRHRKVRAALCHDATTARLARQHNDANVLALGARTLGEEVAKDCLAVFLSTDYEGGRHDRRVNML